MRKPDNVTVVPTNSKTVFRKWLEFMRPYHKLTDREMDVAAAFIRHRYELSKVISDDTILNNVLMSKDIKDKIISELGITLQHFQVMIGSLRRNGVLLNNRINTKFIPSLQEGSDYLTLMFYFKIEDEQSNIQEDSQQTESSNQ